jgi:hypothetical protein
LAQVAPDVAFTGENIQRVITMTAPFKLDIPDFHAILVGQTRVVQLQCKVIPSSSFSARPKGSWVFS